MRRYNEHAIILYAERIAEFFNKRLTRENEKHYGVPLCMCLYIILYYNILQGNKNSYD